MLLISAWLNVSLDSVQGTNQTQLTYWARIWNYFNEHKSFASDRTPTSLCNRWCAIQTSVSKFVGFYNQINGKNPSGMTEQNKVLCKQITGYIIKKIYVVFHSLICPCEMLSMCISLKFMM